jgi:hypothetical protein
MRGGVPAARKHGCTGPGPASSTPRRPWRSTPWPRCSGTWDGRDGVEAAAVDHWEARGGVRVTVAGHRARGRGRAPGGSAREVEEGSLGFVVAGPVGLLFGPLVGYSSLGKNFRKIYRISGIESHDAQACQ